MLVSWMAYLLLPPNALGGFCYTIAAVFYIYIATLGIFYEPSHTNQGTILLIAASIQAVPFFGSPKYGPGSARWLRRFIYVAVLIPTYITAGISKFRYRGIVDQIQGRFILDAMVVDKVELSSLPELYMYILHHKWCQMFMSWGNMVLQNLLPILTLLGMHKNPIRMLFHSSCICFHLTILFLMWPNFLCYLPLHNLAWNDTTSWFLKEKTLAGRKKATPSVFVQNTWLANIQVGFTFYCLCSFFWVQFRSDYEHLFLKTLKGSESLDPYFPFSENSMFTQNGDPNFVCSMVLTSVVFLLYCYVLFFPKEASTEKPIDLSVYSIETKGAQPSESAGGSLNSKGKRFRFKY